MRIFRKLPAIAAITLIIFAPQAMADKDELPEITEDGLHLVPDSNLAVVYAEPGADLSQYNAVQLMDAYVAFKKNWRRNQNSRSANKLGVSNQDIENIKNNLATEFHQVFVEALEKGGYEVTTESGENVLLIRPAIINLDITAPDVDRASRNYSMTSSAGEMTMYLELYDSVTGDLIAKAIDRQVDKRKGSGFYTWTNSVTNRQAAMRILNGWADILVSALDEAHKNAGGTEAGETAE